jgi:anaerobic selenocysteine-containing dehydrogenase
MRVQSKELFLLKQVRKKSKQTEEKAKIIVAVPNVWLQLPIIDLLFLLREGYTRVNSLEELYGTVKKNPNSIVIIDIFAYAESYRDIMARLKEANSSLSVVPLLAGEELVFAHYLEGNGSCFVVEKEKADRMLLPAISKARQDQELKAAATRLLQEQKQLPTLNKKEVNLMEKEDGRIFGRKIGRRTFLKGSAAAALTGVAVANPGNTVMKALAAGNNAASANSDEKTFVGMCRGNCMGGCALDITVRDGKVVKVMPANMPNPVHTRCCLKGLTHTQRIYDNNRLKHPMKRVGKRGEGQWEQITWEEAIDTIASTWKRLQAQYGKSTVAFHHVGATSGELAYSAPVRLESLLGATNFGGMADMAFMSHIVQTIGLGKMYAATEIRNIEKAKSIIVWGCNVTESVMQDWRFIANAMEKGAKLYAINSTFTTAAAKAIKFLPVKPTTDAILAMAMMNIIIKENWIDAPFMKQATVAPFLVKESDGKYLRLSDTRQLADGEKDAILVRDAEGKIGLPAEIPDPVIEGSFEINGIKVDTTYDLLKKRIAEWTPEIAAKMCELPIEDIYEMARVFGTQKPVTIEMGFGPDRYTNGHYAYFAIAALMMITGNLGREGTGLSYTYPLGTHYTNRMAYQTPPQSPIRLKAPVQMFNKLVTEEKYGDTPVKITSLFSSYANIVGSSVDRQDTLAALDKMELVVCCDMVLSDTARYSDIVLPVVHWFEYTDVVLMGLALPYAVIQEKAIDPLYECKSDFEIATLLGKAMGFGEYFNMTDEETINYILDTDAARAMGITWENMKQKKYIRCYEEDLYIHGKGGVFPTPTGRAQFYLENPKPTYIYGQKYDLEKEKLPSWEPPTEAWEENPLYAKYPLRYVQEHTRWRTHSQFGRIEWLRELDPEPIVKMNPVDAEARGIKNRDIVKVFNDRGYVVLRAIINNGMRPGMVNIPHGWQSDQFIEGHYQDLTSNVINSFIPTGSFTDALVEVKKL